MSVLENFIDIISDFPCNSSALNQKADDLNELCGGFKKVARL